MTNFRPSFLARCKHDLDGSLLKHPNENSLLAPRDPDAPTSDRYHSTLIECLSILIEQAVHNEYALVARNIRKADTAAVLGLLSKQELAKVFVHGHDDAFLRRAPVQYRTVTRVYAAITDFDNVVAQLTKAYRDAHASTPIDKEFQ